MRIPPNAASMTKALHAACAAMAPSIAASTFSCTMSWDSRASSMGRPTDIQVKGSRADRRERSVEAGLYIGVARISMRADPVPPGRPISSFWRGALSGPINNRFAARNAFRTQATCCRAKEAQPTCSLYGVSRGRQARIRSASFRLKASASIGLCMMAYPLVSISPMRSAAVSPVRIRVG